MRACLRSLGILALVSLAFIPSPTMTANMSGTSISLDRETLGSVERMYSLPHGLLTAICQVESGCNPYQRPVREPLTKDYAYGPFQVRRIAYSDTVRQLKLTWMTASSQPKSPANLAAAYLAVIKHRCRTWPRAISYYNTGRCLPTTRYNQKVLRYLPRPTRLSIKKEEEAYYAKVQKTFQQAL